MSDIELKNIVDAIPKRRSDRQFTSAPISLAVSAKLMDPEGLRTLDTGSCRAEYVHAPGQLDDVFTGIIGSYGKIKGASALIALIVPTADLEQGKLAAGFVGEQYVLRATHLGLGSCWVGGMFHFKTLMGRLSVGPDEAVVSVLALGWPLGVKETFAKVLHMLIKRKSLEQIAEKSLLAGPPWLTAALEAVRVAPSAVNRQPWHFSGTPSRVQLKAVNRGPLTPVDIGIAMAHFELTARNSGYNGKWTPINNIYLFEEER